MESEIGDAYGFGDRLLAEEEAYKKMSKAHREIFRKYRDRVDELETYYSEKGEDIDAIFFEKIHDVAASEIPESTHVYNIFEDLVEQFLHPSRVRIDG